MCTDDTLPEHFERFKSAGKASFFDFYRQKNSDSKLRRRLEDLLGPITNEAFNKIKPEAYKNFESAVDGYLDELTSSQPAIAPSSQSLHEQDNVGENADTDAQRNEKNVPEGEAGHEVHSPSSDLSSPPPDTASQWVDGCRYLGSIQADIWCTRSGKSLVQFGEILTIDRTSFTHSGFKHKDDFLIRVYNSRNLNFARIREEDSRFMAVLIDAGVAKFDATVIYSDPNLRIGSTVTVQLNCYLKKSAFSTLTSFGMDLHKKAGNHSVDESKESGEEKFVRLRQQALVIMFNRLGRSEAKLVTPAAVTSPNSPLDSTIPEAVVDEEEEMTQDQLDIFYKDGIASRKDNEPQEETEPPASFAYKLFPYQKRGLTWMLDRERIIDANDYASSETHPLWTKVEWPEGDPFWVNFNSGELSTSRPTLALKCRGGILADDMGLGKTISTLSLIHSAATNSVNRSQCTLIVTPTTLLSQWESEAQKVNNSPNSCGCFVYYRSNNSVKSCQSALSQFVHNANFNVKIVLTTYGMVSSEHKNGFTSSGLFGVEFDRVILDEAHNIKNRATQTAKSCFDLKASRRWALTGTPVVNRLEDLYSLVRFIGLEPWNNFAFWRAFVTIKFQKPETREVAMKTVQAVVTPICLRRTKAMKDPETGKPLVELPSKTIEIKRVQFSKEEKVLYSHLYTRVQRSVQSKMRDGTASSKYSAILALLLRLRQVCCHPLLLRHAIAEEHRPAKRVKLETEEDDDLKLDLSGDINSLLATFTETPSVKYTAETLKNLIDHPLEEQECAICSENHNEPVLTECLHAACYDCMITHIDYLKNRGDSPICPLCRAPISASKLFVVNRQNKTLQPRNNSMQSTKIRALINSLREAAARGMGKSVVFSQFTTFLDLIQANLKDNGFAVFRFDGSMTPAQRSEAQEGFKSAKDKNAVLLLSQKAGGVGLNLVAANHAYLMDPWWNYASESQAIDRIYRLGQTDDVNITRFIVQGSIEERILKIQERKRVLSSLVTEEEKRSDNLENIRMLFEIDEINEEEALVGR